MKTILTLCLLVLGSGYAYGCDGEETPQQVVYYSQSCNGLQARQPSYGREYRVPYKTSQPDGQPAANQQQELENTPMVPEVPNRDAIWKVKMPKSEIQTVEWIKVRIGPNKLRTVPVVNGFLPQTYKENGRQYCSFDLKIPFDVDRRRQYRNQGYLNYMPATQEAVAHYRNRVDTAKIARK